MIYISFHLVIVLSYHSFTASTLSCHHPRRSPFSHIGAEISQYVTNCAIFDIFGVEIYRVLIKWIANDDRCTGFPIWVRRVEMPMDPRSFHMLFIFHLNRQIVLHAYGNKEIPCPKCVNVVGLPSPRVEPTHTPTLPIFLQRMSPLSVYMRARALLNVL